MMQNKKTGMVLASAAMLLGCLLSGLTLADGPATDAKPSQSFDSPAAKDAYNVAVIEMYSVAEGNSLVAQAPFNRKQKTIDMGGVVNFSTYYSMNAHYTSFPVMSGRLPANDTSDIYINNANLLLFNNYGIAHTSLNLAYFGQPTLTTSGSFTKSNDMTVDEAILLLADFSKSPFYAKLGKFYSSYGSYHPYAVIEPLTQALSAVNATGGEIGYISPAGYYIKTGLFSGSGNQSLQYPRQKIDNYSVEAGYNGAVSSDFAVIASIDYLNDIRDLSYLNSLSFQGNYSVQQFILQKGLSGLALMLKVHNRDPGHQYDVAVKYVRFNGDVNATYQSPLNPHPGIAQTITLKAPWALGSYAGYKVNIGKHVARFGVGAEFTGNAAFLMLPRTRYLIQFMLQIQKHVKANLETAWDNNYDDKILSNHPIMHNNVILLGLTAEF